MPVILPEQTDNTGNNYLYARINEQPTSDIRTWHQACWQITATICNAGNYSHDSIVAIQYDRQHIHRTVRRSDGHIRTCAYLPADEPFCRFRSRHWRGSVNTYLCKAGTKRLQDGGEHIRQHCCIKYHNRIIIRCHCAYLP